MCGITLVWDRDQQTAELACRRATDAQSHRGPDEAGFHSLPTPKGWLALGHRRLSILDLSPTGAQPMVDPHTQNAIVFNGEIYNFRDLRSELVSKGASFQGHSDTEVLLLGYRQWGPKVFDYARGMFAVAIWDATDHCLVVARDHIGMKPVYVFNNSARLIIASELQAVMQSSLVRTDLDRSALAGHLAYGSVPEPQTMIQDVTMFPAATWARIDLRNGPRLVEQEQYWSLPLEVDPSDNCDFGDLLDESLRGHLQSDVPVGLFLSGGIDSTAIAEAATRVGTESLQTLNVGFTDNAAIDETDLAMQTSRQLGTAHHVVTVSNAEALQQANSWMASIDQPCLDGFNTYLVSQAARQVGLKVALSGLGGDELFGGYSSFRSVPTIFRWSRFARMVPEPARRWLASQAYPKSNPTARFKASDLAGNLGSLSAMLLCRRRLFSDTELSAFDLDSESLGLTPAYIPPERRMPELANGTDFPAAVAAMEASFYMRDTLLRDSDVSGMTHSLEIRLPLLDRDLLTAALLLPARRRMSPNGTNKPALVKACGPCTASVSQLPKRGFSLPYHDWIRGPLQEQVRANVDFLATTGILPEQELNNSLSQFYQNRTPTAPWSRVWCLAVLGSWLQRIPKFSRDDLVTKPLLTAHPAKSNQ